MDHQSQFLPLDSGIKSQKCIATQSTSGLNETQNQITFLLNKITQLQKNYMCIEAKYQRKIKQLRAQLNEKHKEQTTLSSQLALLAKQYEDHKKEIQKISEQIKKSLQNQGNTKPKSKSPKNHGNNSPKRLIKKSLQFDKKEQHKKEMLKCYPLNDSQTFHSKNTERTDQNMMSKKENKDQNEQNRDKNIPKNIQKQKQKQYNKLNESQNSKRALHSPKNGTVTNGPSPKKKILFNSSKQLDIFNPKNNAKKMNANTIFGVGISPTRKLNNSPMGIKKKVSQKQTNSNNITTTNQSISQQVPKVNILTVPNLDKKNNVQHQNHLITESQNQKQIKKPYSPSNGGYLKKKVYSPNTGNKISSPIRPVRQVKPLNAQVEQKKIIRTSPNQSKQIKSPKKLTENSPTHKKIESNKTIPLESQKKTFGKLRQKVHVTFC